MKRRTFVAAAASATAATVAGCTGGGDGGGGDGGSVETVSMIDTTFEPLRLRIAPGTTVEWVNKDSFPHTVVSAQFHPDVASEWSVDVRVESDESTTHTFEEPGVYEYYCDVHGKETMCGVVLAGDVSLDRTLPCEESDGGGY